MVYSIKHIASVINGQWLQFHHDDEVEYLLPDSRKLIFPAASLFFALRGPRRDGHSFIPDLYQKGVRNFVVSMEVNAADCPEANIILVHDTVEAMQQLVALH